MIVVVTPRQWARLLDALNLTGPVAVIERERGVSFATDDGLRFAHRDALFPLFEAAFAARDHAELATALDAGGIVHSAYRTMREAAQDPRLVGNNPMFDAGAANPSGFAYPAAGPFGTVVGQARGKPQPAPRNGQHSEQVLSERLGLASGEIARLIDAGVVGVPRG
jgi:2-methylfumaryl-CoA isomerase